MPSSFKFCRKSLTRSQTLKDMYHETVLNYFNSHTGCYYKTHLMSCGLKDKSTLCSKLVVRVGCNKNIYCTKDNYNVALIYINFAPWANSRIFFNSSCLIEMHYPIMVVIFKRRKAWEHIYVKETNSFIYICSVWDAVFILCTPC